MNEQTQNQIVMGYFDCLYKDMEEKDEFWESRPLLAHYTTIENLENILRNNEVWLSNPLFMNDFEELRFGLLEGVNIFLTDDRLKTAFQSIERFEKFAQNLRYYLDKFDQDEVMNTYIFCLSKHDLSNADGKLSMWRGYGGNGNGAALIFDTSKIDVRHNSPIRLARVKYGTNTERHEWIKDIVASFVSVVEKEDIEDNQIFLASYAVFRRLQVFALYTKHSGFEEEQEWRVVYDKENDTQNIFDKFRHYHIGPRGVEPKLRFRFEPIEGFTSEDFCLEKYLNGIILGPTTSNPLARKSVERMLDLLGFGGLKDVLISSTIPYRSS